MVLIGLILFVNDDWNLWFRYWVKLVIMVKLIFFFMFVVELLFISCNGLWLVLLGIFFLI